MSNVLGAVNLLTSNLSFTSLFIVTALVYLFTRSRRIAHERNPKGLPLPPGPKGLPIVGKLFDRPIEKPWLIYEEWSKVYGKVYSDVAARSLLIVQNCR